MAYFHPVASVQAAAGRLVFGGIRGAALPAKEIRQGNDVGTQYRSSIFYLTEAQKVTAEKVKAQVDKSGKWKAPLQTEIVKASEFYNAEDYHQDYLQKHPQGYTCHFLRD